MFSKGKFKNQRFKKRIVPYLLLLPAVLILLFTTVYPLLYSFSISFTSWSLRTLKSLSFVGLDNYRRVLQSPEVRYSFMITIVFVAASIAIELPLGLMIALLMNRKFKGRRAARSVLLLPMMMVPVTLGLTGRLMFNSTWGIINQLLGLLGIKGPSWLGDASYALISVILVDVWQWTPFVFLILLAGLQSLPQEIYEAAEIDGASKWNTFTYITLPMLRPIMLITVLLRTVDAFRTFDTIFILTRGGPGLHTEVISLHAYRHAFQFWNLGFAASLSWFILIVVIMISQVYINFYYKYAKLNK